MTNKKIFRVLALAAFVAMVVIAPLQAAPDCGKPGCPKTGDQEKMAGKGCMAKAEGCMMLNAIPNLSPEQKAKLEKLHAEHQKAMAATKADMEKLHAEMQGLMKDPVDLKKAEAKIDEATKMKAAMLKKCLAQRQAVRALLTPEQQAKLPAMGGCMMGGQQMAGMSGCQNKAEGCCQKAQPQVGKGCGQQHGQQKAGCAAKPGCQAKIAGEKPEEKK